MPCRKITVLRVPATGEPELGETEPHLQDMQREVGGYIEAISGVVGNVPWHAYINEDAKMMFDRMPRNERAGRLLEALGWEFLPGDYIAGQAVFLGQDEEGGEQDVPDEVVRVARLMGLLPNTPTTSALVE